MTLPPLIPCAWCSEELEPGQRMCPSCDGDQDVDEIPCTRCDQTGVLDALDTAAVTPATISPPYRPGRCPDCKGRGRIEAPCAVERVRALDALGGST